MPIIGYPRFSSWTLRFIRLNGYEVLCSNVPGSSPLTLLDLKGYLGDEIFSESKLQNAVYKLYGAWDAYVTPGGGGGNNYSFPIDWVGIVPSQLTSAGLSHAFVMTDDLAPDDPYKREIRIELGIFPADNRPRLLFLASPNPALQSTGGVATGLWPVIWTTTSFVTRNIFTGNFEITALLTGGELTAANTLLGNTLLKLGGAV